MQIFGLEIPLEMLLVILCAFVVYVAVMVKIARKPKQEMVATEELSVETRDEKLSDEEKKEILEKLTRV